MKHYAVSKQEDPKEINDLISALPMCTLVTVTDQEILTGVFNPVYVDNSFYLHLNKTDDQFKALDQGARSTLTFFDFLCVIPSHWVDPQYGGAATSYYRHAEF